MGDAGNDWLNRGIRKDTGSGSIFPETLLPLSSSPLPAGSSPSEQPSSFLHGKVRLSVCAGFFAGLLVVIGFLSFDAGKDKWYLQRKYPQATSSAERYLLYSKDLYERGELQQSERILRNVLRKIPVGLVRADALLLFGRVIDSLEPSEKAAKEARESYTEFITNYPTDPRVPEARMLLSRNYARAGLFFEANSEYEKLLRSLPEKNAPEVEFLMAENYYKGSSYSAAIRVLKGILESPAPADVSLDARLQLGRIYAEMGKQEQSEEYLLALVQDAPGTLHAAKALQALAQNAFNRKQYQSAADYCKRWFSESPLTRGREEMMLLFGKAQLALHNPSKAAEAASDVINFFPESPSAAGALVLRGKALEELKQPQEAEAAYREAIELYSDNSAAYKELARLEASMGNLDEAIRLAERLCRRYPEDDAAPVELAKLYRSDGENVKAEELLQGFIHHRQLSPEIGKAYLLLAEIQCEQKDPDAAFDTLDRLLATGTTTVKQEEVFERQGDILAQAGLTDDALEAYLLAREKDKKSPQVTIKIAQALFDSKKFEDCLKELSSLNSAALEPASRADALSLQARAEASLGKKEEARRSIQEALALGPKQEKISNLALFLQLSLSLDDRADAAKIVEQTRELISRESGEISEDARNIVLDWAQYLYEKQEYQESARVYSSISSPPFSTAETAWAAYQMGNCCYKLNDRACAEKAYERVKTEFPDSPWVAFAKQRMELLDLMARNVLQPAGDERRDGRVN